MRGFILSEIYTSVNRLPLKRLFFIMAKRLRKILFILCIGLLSLLVLFAALLYSYREPLKEKAIAELNKLLTQPLLIEDVDISFNKFPKAAIKLSRVFCQGAHSSEKDTLLSAESVYLAFDLWDISKSSLKIDRISIENGLLNIERKTNGRHNYLIWTEKDTAKQSTLLAFEEINLQDMRLYYSQESPEIQVSSYQKSLVLSGSLTENAYEFDIKQKGRVNSLVYKGETYFRNGRLQNTLHLEGSEKGFFITKALADLEGISMSYKGVFEEEKNQFYLSSNQEDLDVLFPLLFKQPWMEFPIESVAGKFSAELFYESSQNGKSAIKTKGFFEGVTFEYAHLSLKKAKASFTHSFDGKKNKLELTDINVPFSTGSINGSFRIDDFEEPVTSGHIEASLAIQEWEELLTLDTIESGSGTIALSMDFRIPFEKRGIVSKRDLARATLNGEIDLNELNFKFKKALNPIADLRGIILLKNKSVELQELFFSTGKSDFFFDGTLNNALNWACFPEEKLGIDGRLKAQELQLEDLIKSESANSTTSGYNLEFIKNVDLSLTLDVMAFRFKSFRAQNINGFFESNNGVFYGKELRMQNSQGLFTGAFTLSTRQLPYKGNTTFSLEAIDIAQFFKQFNHFGQDVLRAENLEGSINATVEASALLDGSLNVLLPSVAARAELEILRGRLLNFEPLQALSDYVEMEELRNVRFEDLKNTVHISGEKIDIPFMLIENSALNLGFTGRHAFDNTIDYSVKLKMADALFNKRRAKARKSEFDAFLIEQESKDNPAIYLKMTGQAGNPQVSLDKEALGQSLKQDLKKQGRDLKAVFGTDTIPKKKNDPGILYTWPEEDDG